MCEDIEAVVTSLKYKMKCKFLSFNWEISSLVSEEKFKTLVKEILLIRAIPMGNVN